MAEVAEEVVEEAEEGVEEVAQQRAQQRQEGETQNSSERNHLPSMGIDKTSTGSFQTFRDTCL